MRDSEAAKAQLDLYLEKQAALFSELKDTYDLDDADAVERSIYRGDINLEWFEQREVSYAADIVRCQQMLVRAFALLETGDQKSLHNANKAFETLVSEARRIRKDKSEDIRKAQEVISELDKMICICDEHRRK